MSGYSNVNLGNVGVLKLAAQNALVARIAKRPQVTVITLEEAGRITAPAGWRQFGKYGEVILVRNGTTIVNTGSKLSSPTRQGYKMRLRVYRWVTIFDDDLDRNVTVWVVHNAARWMKRQRPIYARRLRRFLRNSPAPWIALGDWNEYIDNDPCRLARDLDAIWVGQRIDGAAIHPELAGSGIHSEFVMDPPDRPDKHHTTHIWLTKRRTTIRR